MLPAGARRGLRYRGVPLMSTLDVAGILVALMAILFVEFMLRFFG
jgi:hypothetical protein